MNDTERFTNELRAELQQALKLVTVRLAVDKPEETFNVGSVLAVFVIVALENAMASGVAPDKFITALRGVADQLDLQLQAKFGVFQGRVDERETT